MSHEDPQLCGPASSAVSDKALKVTPPLPEGGFFIMSPPLLKYKLGQGACFVFYTKI